MNAMALAMMAELADTSIKVRICSPAFTKTNLNGYAGTESVEDGSREVVRVALLGPDDPSGTWTRWETNRYRGDAVSRMTISVASRRGTHRWHPAPVLPPSIFRCLRETHVASPSTHQLGHQLLQQLHTQQTRASHPTTLRRHRHKCE